MTKEQFYTTELPKIKEYLRQEKEKAAQKLRQQKEQMIFALNSISLCGQLERRVYKN